MQIDRSVNIEPSGTGIVAYGCMFADRSTVVRWCTKLASTGVYKDIDDVVDIHGHDGATQLEWL